MEKNYFGEEYKQVSEKRHASDAAEPTNLSTLIKQISVKEALALLAFIGSVASVLLFFGFSQGADFPIFNYLSFTDYINAAITFFVPLFVSSFIGVLIYPFTNLFRIKNTNVRRIKKIDRIGFYVACLLIPLLYFTVFTNYIHYATNTTFDFSNKCLIIRFIGIIALCFIMQIVGSLKTMIFFKVKKFKYVLIIAVLSFFPTYAIAVTIFGVIIGDETKRNIPSNAKWEIIMKDNQKIKAELIFNLEKYAILNNDSLGIVAIRSENIKSMRKY